MKITIKCSKCSNDKFEMPTRPNNASKVTCSKCGHVETYGKLVKRLEDKAVEDVKRKLGKIFK